MSGHPQPGILAPLPANARHLFFDLEPEASPERTRTLLAGLVPGDDLVVGVGRTVTSLLDARIDGLREAPPLEGVGVSFPSTPVGLWAWLRGGDRGDLVHRTRELREAVSPSFELVDVLDSFVHGDSLDLTGYVDGTENPTGDDAARVALVSGLSPGLDGSSFVAVQRWRHDLAAFFAMSESERDATIGRRIRDNEEIEDAPESAHVKRTAQEDFEPEAFLVRRSMPWADPESEGLVFVAFAAGFEPFEALCRRMLGVDDGVTDALFRFTAPETSSYFWCPPMEGERLDLSALV